VGENFTLSPTLAHFNPAVAILPNNLSIILSATAKESVDLAAVSYQINSHVIHIFDHHSASREIGHTFTTKVPSKTDRLLTVQEALHGAGYHLFDYSGDREAQTLIVSLNGPLGLAAKSFANRVTGLGVVTVRVLRPWNEAAFLETLPSGVKNVHVFDDVPSEASQGVLYADVLGSLIGSGPVVHAHRLTPKVVQDLLSSSSLFEDFVTKFATGLAPAGTVPPSLKNISFFSTPGSTLSGLPHIVEQTFISNPTTSGLLLTKYDVVSRPRGVTLDRIVLSAKEETDHISPAAVDFLAILDDALLKSHTVLAHAKRGSSVLIVTSWTIEELISNLPSETAALINDHELSICTFNAVGIAADLVGAPRRTQNALQNALVYLAFLRLYLGKAAKEEVVEQIARKSALGEVLNEVDLTKVSGRAWAGLSRIIVPSSGDYSTSTGVNYNWIHDLLDLTAVEQSIPLKEFEFNAIAVETDEGDTVVNGAKIASWHDAAKHIIFPNAFSPHHDISTEQYPQNPSLHPESPDRTFLVTCTVNKRLTPAEYDRNVFHLEFDTNGTGLKYEIGEALGVHGWNDEQHILDFCNWYGVQPDRLITIPVPGAEGELHTRTVFQALQQQIDLFGKPPKSFFYDLAEFATEKVDRLALRFIGSAEGAATLKKLSEKDTVHFADVLKRYASARPGIEVLCSLIGDIKPRHYSIASAQAVVGNRIDLLVVTVEWNTPSGKCPKGFACNFWSVISGSPRYGQCTRYLAGLKVGQKVTVSIKPSVMKVR
jgi:sulfite reductase (NADPH) flavoprotein alpha-component